MGNAEKAFDAYSTRYQTDKEKARIGQIEEEKAANEAAWAARRQRVSGCVGARRQGRCGTSIMRCQGEARQKFKDEHPGLKAMNILAYNPEEYAQAVDLFRGRCGQLWVGQPAYAETDETKAARRAYQDKYPQVKLLSAWLYGRPANSLEGRRMRRGLRITLELTTKRRRSCLGMGFGICFGPTVAGCRRQRRVFFEQHP